MPAYCQHGKSIRSEIFELKQNRYSTGEKQLARKLSTSSLRLPRFILTGTLSCSTGRFLRESFNDIGRHNIDVHFNSTDNGIAVDYVEIDADDNFMTPEFSMCQLTTVPWNSGYAQVFLKYQDGNTRLLPVPPDGVNWIPFGSFGIIRQANPTVERPYATIIGVQLDLQYLIMNVKYKDGGSAKLKLEYKLKDIRKIMCILLQHLAQCTFQRVIPMRISVNGVQPRHIMVDFGSIMGKSFVFYRKCMSKHLNLSPDIYIEVRETETAVEDLQKDKYLTGIFSRYY
ncbi:hypothetical protein CHS0354_006656 [Potamilus streckersoni]|uniref:Uncharacterized protein n=1 Tax=Potamilus streckersoni TaxID=2493646 RepID=A0AAE0SWH6_9BIVA|nr:hypothetical protein CHS0354_006656 [Potamilus streckersoni]